MDVAAMQTLGATRNRVGESPLWSVAEQALYWVDIEGRRLHRFDWASGDQQSWPTAERIACIALHADGGLLAGMESGLFHIRPAAGGCASTLLAAITFARDGMRFNDGRCDRQGRFWVSSMVMDMSLAASQGALYCFEAGVLSAPRVTGLLTGNGLGFSPDGATLYLSDSHPAVRQVWAFDLDAAGLPSRRRVFGAIQKFPGRPDGAAVDAEGAYWICGNDGGQVHRFMADGSHDRSITVPVSKPSMCAFGGPGLDRLFITSIQPGKPAEGYDASLDGAVFITQPGVKGLPETPYKPGDNS
jgi:sugar lactone lactonase YvrE